MTMRLVFVGSGVSCAIPVIGHLDNGDNCACKDATEHPDGRNKRNNVSLLLQLPADGKEQVNVLIDCGKTFREAYFRVLAPRRIRHVDVLLLTHGHADAMQCVEELCELHTETHRLLLREENCAPLPASLQHIPTYLTVPTLREVQDISPGLVAASRSFGAAPQNKREFDEQCAAWERHIEAASTVTPSSLDLFIVPEEKPVPLYVDALHSTADGAAAIPFYSLPVEHGAGYISLGYVFGRGTAFKTSEEETSEAARERRAAQLRDQSCVVYISDVSEIIPPSLAFLDSLVKIDLLVFDLLAEKGRSSPSHTCWDDCMPVLRRLTPRRTYFVGMFCSLLHEPSNQLWREDLEKERERVRGVALQKRGCASDAETARMKRFVEEVESAELVYDGLELVLPL